MPHIAGESLRARIAHERELPVGDTVRILRDVCDALAYAHGHGIVQDRKSTRLNSSHLVISYAVFCLKKKKDWLPTSGTKSDSHAVPTTLATRTLVVH